MLYRATRASLRHGNTLLSDLTASSGALSRVSCQPHLRKRWFSDSTKTEDLKAAEEEEAELVKMAEAEAEAVEAVETAQGWIPNATRNIDGDGFVKATNDEMSLVNLKVGDQVKVEIDGMMVLCEVTTDNRVKGMKDAPTKILRVYEWDGLVETTSIMESAPLRGRRTSRTMKEYVDPYKGDVKLPYDPKWIGTEQSMYIRDKATYDREMKALRAQYRAEYKDAVAKRDYRLHRQKVEMMAAKKERYIKKRMKQHIRALEVKAEREEQARLKALDTAQRLKNAQRVEGKRTAEHVYQLQYALQEFHRFKLGNKVEQTITENMFDDNLTTPIGFWPKGYEHYDFTTRGGAMLSESDLEAESNSSSSASSSSDVEATSGSESSGFSDYAASLETKID